MASTLVAEQVGSVSIQEGNRGKIVRFLREEQEKLVLQRDAERQNFDTSETNRADLQLSAAERNATLTQVRQNILDLKHFCDWLGKVEPNPQEPLQPGNMWLLKDQHGSQEFFLIYDEWVPVNGVRTPICLDYEALRKELGANITAISKGCGFHTTLAKTNISIGMNLSQVMGGDPKYLLEIF